jgi:hypothetical protein
MHEYQAIYDAVRSRMGNCDVSGAVENAMRDAGFGHYAEMAGHAIQSAAAAYEEAATAQKRPSAIYRPALSLDGNQWCMLYGANLHDGVAGFGDTPAAAADAFDKNWNEERAVSLFKETP